MCIVDGHLHVVERSIAVCPQTMSGSNVTVQKKINYEVFGLDVSALSKKNQTEFF